MNRSSLRPTKKQQAVLEYIDTYIKQNNHSPSYREVAVGCNLNSVATAAKHINNLIARGHLTKRPNSARSLEIAQPNQAASSGETHEQWLCSRLDTILEADTPHDDAYVLVGALKILGFDKSFRTYVKKLNS